MQAVGAIPVAAHAQDAFGKDPGGGFALEEAFDFASGLFFPMRMTGHLARQIPHRLRWLQSLTTMYDMTNVLWCAGCPRAAVYLGKEGALPLERRRARMFLRLFFHIIRAGRGDREGEARS
jgi:hypothetical protein